jgi:F0F1-type ATP synthase assembly protein I
MGDGVNVTVGMEISVGLVVAVLVGVTVGVDLDIRAAQLTVLMMLKITMNNMKKFETGFEIISFHILCRSCFSA